MIFDQERASKLIDDSDYSDMAKSIALALAIGIILAIAVLLTIPRAQAAEGHHHVKHHFRHHAHHTARHHRRNRPRGYDHPTNEDEGNASGVLGGRPAGCPHSFCGCEASRYLFGRIIPALNLASNWARKFPRTSPAPRMAAVRSHHVFVLMSHVGGSNWLVHDGNSGGHLTREHARSIAGYVIVNPNGSRIAMR